MSDQPTRPEEERQPDEEAVDQSTADQDGSGPAPLDADAAASGAPASPEPVTHGPPPRGPATGLVIAAVVVALLVFALGLLAGPPLHTWLAARQAAAEADPDARGTWYISQMHPWIIQPEPGLCPICGMDLVPVDPARFAGEISIDPVVVQNMGVRVAPATMGNISRELRTVGTVTLDESQVTDVVLRFGGWITEVFVTAQWNHVAAGDPLFSIYAPSVFTAEQEYLIARRSAARDGSQTLLQAARDKLRLLDVPAAELERLEQEGVARDTITITSPASGVVWQKAVNQGSEIVARSVAYRIVDLSQVWIEATLYEDQLPFVTLQQSARIRLSYGDQRELQGQVSAIYPVVDERTRAVRASFVFSNREENGQFSLKPGMFATVFLDARLAEEVVTVPQEAVIGTGERKIVFVSRGRGRFEPREVTVGHKGSQGRIAIRDGIANGETVVVSGQFLLDSESKMREGLAKFMQGDLAGDQTPPAPVAAQVVMLPEESLALWTDLLDRYVATHAALQTDDAARIRASVDALAAAVAAFVQAARTADQHFVHRHPLAEALAQQATALHSAEQAALRPALGALSITLDALVKTFGQPPGLPQRLVGMRCGMAEGVPDGGVWLQPDGAVQNPYLPEMRRCAADTWSLPMMATDSDSPSPAAPEVGPEQKEAPGVHDQPVPEPHASAAVPADLIEAVLAIQAALFADDLEQARGAAAAVPATAPGPAWATLRDQAAALAGAADLAAARRSFSGLSVILQDALATGGTTDQTVLIHRCDMATRIADQPVWLERPGTPHNPYFGREHGMANCTTSTWRVTRQGLVEVP